MSGVQGSWYDSGPLHRCFLRRWRDIRSSTSPGRTGSRSWLRPRVTTTLYFAPSFVGSQTPSTITNSHPDRKLNPVLLTPPQTDRPSLHSHRHTSDTRHHPTTLNHDDVQCPTNPLTSVPLHVFVFSLPGFPELPSFKGRGERGVKYGSRRLPFF